MYLFAPGAAKFGVPVALSTKAECPDVSEDTKFSVTDKPTI